MIATAFLSAALLASPPVAGEGEANVAAAPVLSISVDNARADAAAGDRMTYTLRLRNLGTVDVTDLRLTQSVPAGLRFDTAEPAGTAAGSGVSWQVDIEPAGETVIHSTMTVLESDAGQPRAATVACARTADEAPPLVCASHSARLRGEAGSADDSWANRNRWYLAGGVFLLAGIALFVVRVRGSAIGADDAAGNGNEDNH
ncbi:DUF11 domain-containing protein [Actinokineospora auranticolor]|uniref:Putative repeat protein (TIGR01451 family) n=1 Tax=Actinokineospora auranticolor TaxID=155976 RepID=A0A2S6GCI8_9PSEU|nr:DUF11 domain-containing protein [Actinokineospora auranticolor]PPK62567.1 putative repeat protein (TIGR01451 family) [Actinokineospora auranticolor]